MAFKGQSIGTLADYLVADNPELLGPAADDLTTERIRAIVRNLVSEQLGIPPDLGDDVDFVHDLKVD